jgi:hypothetical protein
MSCCKGKVNSENKDTAQLSISTKSKNYIVKTLIFLFMLCCLPVFIVYFIWVLFKNIVLSSDVNILPLVRKIIIKLNNKLNNEDVDADDDESYLAEDYEIINVETIK